MNIDYVVPIILGIVIIYFIAKGNKKKKKSKGISFKFNIDQNMLLHCKAGLGLIKKNPALHKAFNKQIRNITLVPGYIIINSKEKKNYIAVSSKGSNTIIISHQAMQDTMRRPEYKNVIMDLWAKVLIHEYGHTIGYGHGPDMTRWQTEQVKSFGGRVDWPTS